MGAFITGLDHIAVNVKNLNASEKFYTRVLGGRVIWKNETNCFIRFGKKDVLALLAVPKGYFYPRLRKLLGNKFSHYGFQARSEKDVYRFAGYLKKKRVKIIKGPYTRSDGSSVYFLDPNHYTLEYFYLKPFKPKKKK